MGPHSRSPLPISVVMPAYNRADLLRASLESVRSQTVPPAEVVVVDDGSSDPLVAEYARAYGANLIRVENGGASRARNIGIAAASSPWIALMDSDDLWLPRKLELQWAAANSLDDCGLVICNYRIFTEHGTFDETAFELNKPYRNIPKRPLYRDANELLAPHAGRTLARSMFTVPSCMLLRREIALQVGGFSERLTYCEDHEFAMRIFAATRAVGIDNALVRYRFHGYSLSKNEVGMRAAAVRVAEGVIENPAPYPPGADEQMHAALPLLLRRAAAAHLKRGEVVNARGYLTRALVRRFTPADAALWLAAGAARPWLSAANAPELVKIWRKRPWRPKLDWYQASTHSITVLERELSQPTVPPGVV